MTKLLQYVEDMRARLSDVAGTERALIRELGEALSGLDRQLLTDVRDLTVEHEARRVAVLSELHGLASRIGSFPAQMEPFEALESEGHSLPHYGAPPPQPDFERSAFQQAEFHHTEFDNTQCPDSKNLDSQCESRPGGVPDSPQASSCGDWRQAVNNIQDDLDQLFGRRGSPH